MTDTGFPPQASQHMKSSDRTLEVLPKFQQGQNQPTSPPHRASHGFGDVVAHNLNIHQGDIYYVNNAPQPAAPKVFGLCLGSAPLIEPDHFVGRAAELEEMAQKLKINEISTEQRRLVLGGMGGIGKTQLAIAYARRHHASYSSVFWLNAVTESSLKADFRTISEQLLAHTERQLSNHDDDRVQSVLHWLADLKETGWMLIFDNYDDPDLFDITTYMPRAAHGSIIITTRLGETINMPQVRIGPLGSLNESLRILQIRSRQHDLSHDDEALRLAKRFQGLPLALATAGFYLRKTTLSFRQYLEVYEQRFNINDRRPVQLPEYRDRTLHTTWDLSYARLERDDALAAHTLQLLTYFDNQEIWFGLLHAGLDKSGCTRWLRDLCGDEVDFASVMSVLVEYCFVEVTPTSGSYNMHNCVHDWTLARLNQIVDQELYWYAIDCVTNLVQDFSYVTLAQPSYARLARQATCSIHYRFTQSVLPPIQPLYRIHQILKLACSVSEQLEFEVAEKWQLRTLDCVKKWLRSDHFLTSCVYHILGSFYYSYEQMHKRTLGGYDGYLYHADTSPINIAYYLGVVYFSKGRLEEAEAILTKVFAAVMEILGPDNPSTLITLRDLGLLLCEQGRLVESEQILLKCLKHRERLSGSENVYTLKARQVLADIYACQNKFREAQQFYLEILLTIEQEVEKDHLLIGVLPDAALANLYLEQDKPIFEKAEQVYQQALSVYEKIQIPNEAAIRSTRYSLCRTISMHIRSRELTTKQSFAKLSLLIGLACMEHKISASVFGPLGRALLYIGDGVNAHKAFEQQCIPRDYGGVTYGGVICDGCDSTILHATRRYVCRQCQDLDLCGQCWDRRDSGALDIASCRNHTFMGIHSGGPPSEDVVSATQSATVWLEQIENKYRKASIQLDDATTESSSSV